MRKKKIIALGFVVVVLGVVLFLWQVDRGPYPVLPPIANEYFSCEKCKSLDGGIYGKGPRESFRSSSAKWCVHDWRRIDRTEFKQAGAERFGIDWSKEGDFWAKD